MNRDWILARQKVCREGKCRVCGARRCDDNVRELEAAHVVGRKYDPPSGIVQADDIVPLCVRWGSVGCHELYDSKRLDLLPYLTIAEQTAAVAHLGIERARNRITGS